MRMKLLKYWDRIRSSFWFLPSVIAGGSVVLAYASISLDEAMAGQLPGWLDWAYSGGAEGASAVLGTIAGSMITIAGVVFSLTLVALSLASSQFGPRLLRNFMRDTTNQVVLGTFIATFLYCLLVLRTIRRAQNGVAFVPELSVTFGVVCALASLGVLIYFIHHVSVSIQADEIIARVAGELLEGIDRLFPEHIGHGSHSRPNAGSEADLPEPFERQAIAAPASTDGYVQFIDAESLMTLAMEEDLVVRIDRRPGHYVVADDALAAVWSAEEPDDRIIERVQAAFVLGSERTPAQDVEYSVNQLVEIAVRALSPGVNDPFTAIACVDRLTSALSRLCRREIPSPCRLDEHSRLRVVAPTITFPAILDAAFNQVRQYGRASVAVTLRLLEAITVIASFASREEDRAALSRQAQMIMRGARDALQEEEDRRAVDERYTAARRALER